MEKYIDPTYDIGFKLLFGRENVSEDFLIDFLNSLFAEVPDLRGITAISYLNNERTSDWEGGKGIRYDIMCRTATGHHFIVEMQKAHQTRFRERAKYYVSKAIVDQLYKGDDIEETNWNNSLSPVIGVFVCDFHVSGLEKKYITRGLTMDEDTFKPIDMLTRYVYIQLPFFDKAERECDENIDKWIYNIKNMGSLQEVAFKSQNEIFQRLAKVGSVAALSPAEKRWYEADIKRARDMLNQFRSAREVGFEEGRAEGIAEGRAEGAHEMLVQSVKSMRSNGLDDATIARFLNASLEVVASIE